LRRPRNATAAVQAAVAGGPEAIAAVVVTAGVVRAAGGPEAAIAAAVGAAAGTKRN
jgi:hypothetical protein